MSQKNAYAELISRRYAQAFFSTAVTQDEINSFIEVATTLLEDSFFNTRIKSYTRSKLQADWIENLFSGLSLSEKVKNFFKVIAFKGRLLFLKNILSCIEKENDKRLGLVPIQLIIPEYWPEDKINKFKAQIKEVIGKKPIISILINPEILGGYIIKTSSVIIDNSLLKRIEKLHNVMKGVA